MLHFILLTKMVIHVPYNTHLHVLIIIITAKILFIHPKNIQNMNIYQVDLLM